MQNVSEIIQTVKSGLGLSSNKALAELLDITLPTLLAWQRRKSINYGKIIALCETHGLSLDMVFLSQPDKNTQYKALAETYRDKYLKCLEEKSELQQQLLKTLDK